MGENRGKIERKERGEEEEEFRERESTFSLDIPAIEPAASGETRSKVDPHYKSYAWVPVLWSFDNFGRYGFSPTSFTLWLRVILMVRDVRGPK